MSPADHALEIVGRTAPLRSRISEIGDELRGLPAYQKRGGRGLALLEERRRLLLAVDEMARPDRPTPKPDRNRAHDAKAVKALIAESKAEARADAGRAKARAKAEA